MSAPAMFRTSTEVPIVAHQFRQVNTLLLILASALGLAHEEMDLGRTIGAFR